MTQPIEHPESGFVGHRRAANDEVFPRWVTVSVMLAWVALMAWAIPFSTGALG
ncbi:MAG: hypothetical protein AAGC53_17805 [Actinomycetota bacterium]